jgi:hypothetical protein
LRLSRKTKDALPRFVKALRERDPQLAQTLSQGVVPYDLIIHSQTDLQLRARLEQSGQLCRRDTLTIRASLREYDVPVERRATVWADTTWPDSNVSVRSP